MTQPNRTLAGVTSQPPSWVADLHAFRNRSPEAEALYRLLSAVEHYERMGWLQLPGDERWKFDEVLEDCRALVHRGEQ